MTLTRGFFGLNDRNLLFVKKNDPYGASLFDRAQQARCETTFSLSIHRKTTHA